MKTPEQVIDELGYNILAELNQWLWWCEPKVSGNGHTLAYIKVFDNDGIDGPYSVYLYERIDAFIIPK